MSVIFDTDKIDFMRYDNKHTIYLYIYDINVWKDEKEIQEHMNVSKKKIESYVNYILSGGALEYFKLSNDKKYSYIIEFVPEPMHVPILYINMLGDYANQIHENFGETIKLKIDAYTK